jgi:hypothetical protein
MSEAVARPFVTSPRLYLANSGRQDAAAVAVLVVLTLIFGLPVLGLEYPDDGFYSEAAHLWAQGAPPYIAVFDIKAPGYFALLALAQMAFGPTLSTIHGLSLACDLATALAIYAIGRRLEARRAGFAAAATFVPLAIFLLENEAYPPLVLAETLAFLAALRPAGDLRQAAFSGLACGVAIALKQTAVLEAAALAVVFLRGRQPPAMLAFLAATAAVPLAFVAYYARLGGLDALFQDVVVDALRRPSIQGFSFFAEGSLFFSKLLVLGPLSLLTLCVSLRLRTPPPGLCWEHAAVLRAWLLAALVELMAQFGNDLNYLSELLPPALLWACLYAERSGRKNAAATLASVAVATVGYFALVRIISVRTEVDETATRQVAAIVESAHPKPGDKLLGLDFALWANVATDLAPPTPFFHRMHLLCAFPGAGPERLAEAFAARPRFLVFGPHRRTRFDCASDSAGWGVIDDERTTNYLAIGDVRGKAGNYIVYERAR